MYLVIFALVCLYLAELLSGNYIFLNIYLDPNGCKLCIFRNMSQASISGMQIPIDCFANLIEKLSHDTGASVAQIFIMTCVAN